MAILKTVYQGSNFAPNAFLYELTVTLDSDITSANISTVLPNNGTRYGTVNGISFLTTGSSATVYTVTKMIITNYIAESGAINPKTGYNEGTWKVLAEIPFK